MDIDELLSIVMQPIQVGFQPLSDGMGQTADTAQPQTPMAGGEQPTAPSQTVAGGEQPTTAPRRVKKKGVLERLLGV